MFDLKKVLEKHTNLPKESINVIDTELLTIEANVRPKIKEFMSSKGLDWHVCWINLTREESEDGNTFVVNIFGPQPGEFIGPLGSTAKDICVYLASCFHCRFYVNARDNKFDPFAPIYEQETPFEKKGDKEEKGGNNG